MLYRYNVALFSRLYGTTGKYRFKFYSLLRREKSKSKICYAATSPNDDVAVSGHAQEVIVPGQDPKSQCCGYRI